MKAPYYLLISSMLQIIIDIQVIKISLLFPKFIFLNFDIKLLIVDKVIKITFKLLNFLFHLIFLKFYSFHSPKLLLIHLNFLTQLIINTY